MILKILKILNFSIKETNKRETQFAHPQVSTTCPFPWPSSVKDTLHACVIGSKSSMVYKSEVRETFLVKYFLHAVVFASSERKQ